MLQQSVHSLHSRAGKWRATICARPQPGASVAPQLRRASSRATNPQAASTVTSTEGLVFASGPEGSWDSVGVGSPVVRCYVGDDEERWIMWYSGRGAGAPPLPGIDALTPSSGSLGVAVSRDGVSWVRGAEGVAGERGAQAPTDVGRFMEPNKDWWTFDTAHMAVSDVQILSSGSVNSGVGVYWMFYTGGDYNTVVPPRGLPGVGPTGPDAPPLEGLRMRPGLAMSQDGRNWARIEGDHHTGALFDVGEEGEWDELMVCGPQVLNAAPRDMRLFYHSWDVHLGRYVVGAAVSKDGFHWTKQGVVFDPAAQAGPGAHDALGATARHVVRDVDNKQYLMFYEAVAADNSRSIGLAVSKDGLKDWKRCPKPILTAAGAGEGAWDAGGVGAPCAVAMSAGKWRLYYAARSGKQPGPHEGIGLALSVDGGATFEGAPTEFKRRTGKAAAPAQ